MFYRSFEDFFCLTIVGYRHKKNLATIACNKVSGWKMGFEPTTLGTTILYSNRLSYIHHLICFSNRVQIYTLFSILQNFQQLFLKICGNNSLANYNKYPYLYII